MTGFLALLPTALFSTFLNISLLSKNQLNTSVLVLALMLLRFGMTCLPTFALLHHWCHSGADSKHIFLERPILLSNLHILVVLRDADPAMSLIRGFALESVLQRLSAIKVILELEFLLNLQLSYMHPSKTYCKARWVVTFEQRLCP